MIITYRSIKWRKRFNLLVKPVPSSNNAISVFQVRQGSSNLMSRGISSISKHWGDEHYCRGVITKVWSHQAKWCSLMQLEKKVYNCRYALGHYNRFEVDKIDYKVDTLQVALFDMYLSNKRVTIIRLLKESIHVIFKLNHV